MIPANMISVAEKAYVVYLEVLLWQIAQNANVSLLPDSRIYGFMKL
jgi:hypothetical protein